MEASEPEEQDDGYVPPPPPPYDGPPEPPGLAERDQAFYDESRAMAGRLNQAVVDVVLVWFTRRVNGSGTGGSGEVASDGSRAFVREVVGKAVRDRAPASPEPEELIERWIESAFQSVMLEFRGR